MHQNRENKRVARIQPADLGGFGKHIGLDIEGAIPRRLTAHRGGRGGSPPRGACACAAGGMALTSLRKFAISWPRTTLKAWRSWWLVAFVVAEPGHCWFLVAHDL